MGESRVFCFCYSHNRPQGGQKDTYRHVDALNAAGIEAMVFHPTNGFRLTWFENNTRVVDIDTARGMFNPRTDFVVVPEDLGDLIITFPGRKVVFNKSVWYGFGLLGDQPRRRYPYLHRDVVAALTMSEHNRDHLRFAYPQLPVFVVKPSIDIRLFSQTTQPRRQSLIAWVPKNEQSVLALMHLLGSRSAQGLNSIDTWSWVRLSGLQEREVAEVLAEALVLIFFSAEECLGRLPLEALASGCVVVGFRNGSLHETVPEQTLFAWGDLRGAALCVESLAQQLTRGSSEYEQLVARGRTAALRFEASASATSVTAAWEQIMRIRV